MRELVHEPMKTVSTAMSRMAVPAVRPMYSSARAGRLALGRGRRSSSGSGTCPSMGDDLAGVGAPGDVGRRRRRVDGHRLVEDARPRR